MRCVCNTHSSLVCLQTHPDLTAFLDNVHRDENYGQDYAGLLAEEGILTVDHLIELYDNGNMGSILRDCGVKNAMARSRICRVVSDLIATQNANGGGQSDAAVDNLSCSMYGAIGASCGTTPAPDWVVCVCLHHADLGGSPCVSHTLFPGRPSRPLVILLN